MSQFIVNIFENFLGDIRKHNKDKCQISFDCPICEDGEGKGNLELNYEKSLFKCWSCSEINGMHGSIPKLIKRFGNSKQLKDYLLLKPDFKYLKAIDDTELVEIDLVLPESFKLLKTATFKDSKYNEVMLYLKNRGITKEIIEEFDIGFTSSGSHFNRIIIPSHSENNFLNYFIARSFRDNINPKYLNPDARKELIIFNEKKINWDATIYLVEGVFDHRVIPNSIPLLGKYLSDKLKFTLYDKAKSLIVVLLDSDATLDAIRLYRELSIGDLRDKIRICIPPDNNDPSLINQRLGKSGIIKLLKTSRKLTNDEMY